MTPHKFFLALSLTVAAATANATNLIDAVTSAKTMKVGQPLKHFGHRTEQGRSAIYQANANVGDIHGVRCDLGAARMKSSEGFDRLFQEAGKRWEPIVDSSTLPPRYFWQTLVLNPKAEFKIVSDAATRTHAIRKCLQWEGVFDQASNSMRTECVKEGEISHYRSFLSWSMRSDLAPAIVYSVFCEKSGISEADAAITFKEFNTVTDNAFIF